ncbi:hypothetical protein HaLaN_02053, partial [Haematococcus lacustris]
MAVNTREMSADPKHYVKLWAKEARSKYGITHEVFKLFVRVVCKYSLYSSSYELRGTLLEDPEWQAWMAFLRHVLTGVPEDVEEAEAPGDPADSEEPEEPEDPDAPPPPNKLPLHRRDCAVP